MKYCFILLALVAFSLGEDLAKVEAPEIDKGDQPVAVEGEKEGRAIWTKDGEPQNNNGNNYGGINNPANTCQKLAVGNIMMLTFGCALALKIRS